MENAFAAQCAHLIHQYIVYICMHCGTVGHFQSEFSTRWFGWDTSPTRLRTLSPRRNPRDLPPRRRQQRRRWRSGGGGDARVPRRCSRHGTRTYVCRSQQCCAARYANAHISQFSGTSHALALSVQTKAKSYHFL